jgi:hypothetical protein
MLNFTESEFQAPDGHGNLLFLVRRKSVKAGFRRRCRCAWVGASEKVAIKTPPKKSCEIQGIWGILFLKVSNYGY